MSFGANLKRMLLIRDISTKELAYTSGLKINTINSYLKTNGTQPTAEKAVKIAKALNTSVEFLVNGFESFPKNDKSEIKTARRKINLIKNLEKMTPEAREPILKMILDMTELSKTNKIEQIESGANGEND